MRLASYNVENLFLRPRAMNGATLAEGRRALADHASLNRALCKDRYDGRDRRLILELLTRLGLDQHDDGGRFAVLARTAATSSPRRGGRSLRASRRAGRGADARARRAAAGPRGPASGRGLPQGRWRAHAPDRPAARRLGGGGAADLRCFRGGNWFSHDRRARSASRLRSEPTLRSANLGFRLGMRSG